MGYLSESDGTKNNESARELYDYISSHPPQTDVKEMKHQRRARMVADLSSISAGLDRETGQFKRGRKTFQGLGVTTRLEGPTYVLNIQREVQRWERAVE